MSVLATSTSIMPDRNQIITDSINEVVSERPGIQNSPREFALMANNRVIEKMIDYFPIMCEDARRINQEKYKLLQEVGNKGKFTETYGWSNDGTFLFEYDIPPDLYYFMQTAVFRDFWSEDNSRVWKGFMKKICRGTPLNRLELQNLLIKIKTHYGSNAEGTPRN
jgi:hypothetical protein